MPGVGQYNLSQPFHITAPKMIRRIKGNNRTSREEKESKKNINPINSYSGTFARLASQGTKRDSNFFGRSQRFGMDKKTDKRPAPNSYKMNN